MRVGSSVQIQWSSIKHEIKVSSLLYCENTFKLLGMNYKDVIDCVDHTLHKKDLC